MDVAETTIDAESGDITPMAYEPLDYRELLTTEDVARLLAVCPTTVRKWAREGTIESMKLGKLLRFHEDWVADFLANGRQTEGVRAIEREREKKKRQAERQRQARMEAKQAARRWSRRK